MTNFTSNLDADPIDVVIAWVDGSDPKHAEKRAKFMGEAPTFDANAIAETRYVQSDEIYTCIASIVKFAPFIRKIWIVTDDQVPCKLKECIENLDVEEGRVEVVDHTVIFRDHLEVLPNFNSMTIGSALWRIPGLSDRFIYFNDDVFLTREVQPEDFFQGDKAVIYGVVQEVPGPTVTERIKRPLRKILRRQSAAPPQKTNMHRASQVAFRLAGRKRDVLIPRHHPHPFRRSVLEEFFSSHPSAWRDQIQHRFRHSSQFIASALNYALLMNRGEAIIKSEEAMSYITFADESGLTPDQESDLISGRFPFCCVQSLDLASKQHRERMAEILRKKFGGLT